jgi:hypothetical protein
MAGPDHRSLTSLYASGFEVLRRLHKPNVRRRLDDAGIEPGRPGLAYAMADGSRKSRLVAQHAVAVLAGPFRRNRPIFGLQVPEIPYDQLRQALRLGNPGEAPLQHQDRDRTWAAQARAVNLAIAGEELSTVLDLWREDSGHLKCLIGDPPPLVDASPGEANRLQTNPWQQRLAQVWLEGAVTVASLQRLHMEYDHRESNYGMQSKRTWRIPGFDEDPVFRQVADQLSMHTGAVRRQLGTHLGTVLGTQSRPVAFLELTESWARLMQATAPLTTPVSFRKEIDWPTSKRLAEGLSRFAHANLKACREDSDFTPAIPGAQPAVNKQFAGDCEQLMRTRPGDVTRIATVTAVLDAAYADRQLSTAVDPAHPALSVEQPDPLIGLT